MSDTTLTVCKGDPFVKVAVDDYPGTANTVGPWVSVRIQADGHTINLHVLHPLHARYLALALDHAATDLHRWADNVPRTEVAS